MTDTAHTQHIARLARLGYLPAVPPAGLAWCMSLDADPAPPITVGQRADGTWVVGTYSVAPTLTLSVMMALGAAGMSLRVIERDQPAADFIVEATAHLERAEALLDLLCAAKDLESPPCPLFEQGGDEP